jgi:hypothetical protein
MFNHLTERTIMEINKRKLTIIGLIIAAIALIIGVAGGATAGALLTGKDIKNGSLTTADYKNGSVKMRDLSPALRKLVKEQAQDGKDGTNGVNGVNGVNGTPGAPGAPGQDGQDGSVAGVQSNWDEKDGANIVDATTVELSNVGTPAGASLEIQNLNLPVQAGKVVTFTYELADGAVYGGGSPRVFFEINGNFVNTHDTNPADAGVDNGDGTFTKSWTIPQNGRVGAAGIVVDSGVGTITISDVTVDGQVLQFN